MTMTGVVEIEADGKVSFLTPIRDVAIEIEEEASSLTSIAVVEIERRPCSTIGWRLGAPNPRLQPMTLAEEKDNSDAQAHKIASYAADKSPIVKRELCQCGT